MIMAFSRFGSRWFSGPRHRPAGSRQQQRHGVGGVALRARLPAAGAPEPSSEAGWTAARMGPGISDIRTHKILCCGVPGPFWAEPGRGSGLIVAHGSSVSETATRTAAVAIWRFSAAVRCSKPAKYLSIIKMHRRRRKFGGRYVLYNYSVHMQNLNRPTASH